MWSKILKKKKKKGSSPGNKGGCPIIPSSHTLECVSRRAANETASHVNKQSLFFFGLTDGGRQAAAEHGSTTGVGILGLVRNRL